MSRLHDTYYISGLDLKDAFWQIALSDESKEITAFTIPNRGHFQFRVMPFGLCNAAQTMSELMNKVIPAKLRDKVFIYLDELLVVSATFEEHFQVLSKVAACLRSSGLTINLEKSKFCHSEIRYLGYIIGNGQLKTDPTKVEAITNFPQPKTIRQLRSFLGLAGWYRRFVKDFPSITAPMSDCLRKSKSFIFTPEAEVSFKRLKIAMSTAPLLIHPDFKKHFYVQCDASSSGIGSVLFQLSDDGKEHPIAFMSKKLNPCQKKYTVTELECYAVVCSVKQYRSIIEGLPFTIITDHSALRWLMAQKDLDGKLARWSLKLQHFNFTIEHRKGALNTVPDVLSRVDMAELACDVPIDINLYSPAFTSHDYLNLIESINKFQDSLPDLKVRNGVVFKRTKFRKGFIREEDDLWKIWVPEPLRRELLVSLHCAKTTGHPGIGKTYYRLTEKYFWPKMFNDISEFVNACSRCKENKPTNVTMKNFMESEQITERPFQRLNIDFMGSYPRTARGNTNLLTILDHFSKFVCLKPLTKATADKVISFLENNVFNCFGVPQFLHSDNGQQFKSKLFLSFLEKYGIIHVLTGTHHPQANAVERSNRTILQRIRNTIDDMHDRWDIDIPKLECSLRSEVHTSIGTTPYYCLFGNHMIQHGSSYEVLKTLKCMTDEDINVIPRHELLAKIRGKVSQNLTEAHERSKRTYNLRARNINYPAGQEIYYRNFEQSDKASKRISKFAPFFKKGRIRSKIGNSLYEIEDLRGKLIGRYPTIHLKT